MGTYDTRSGHPISPDLEVGLCDLCGDDPGSCECPECPTCSCTGCPEHDFKAIGTHVADLRERLSRAKARAEKAERERADILEEACACPCGPCDKTPTACLREALDEAHVLRDADEAKIHRLLAKIAALRSEAGYADDCRASDVQACRERDAARQEVERLREALPDDIRERGWTVAVHNDYRQNGISHTFWLFTRNGVAIKGEGRTDAEALGRVRAVLATTTEAPGETLTHEWGPHDDYCLRCGIHRRRAMEPCAHIPDLSPTPRETRPPSRAALDDAFAQARDPNAKWDYQPTDDLQIIRHGTEWGALITWKPNGEVVLSPDLVRELTATTHPEPVVSDDWQVETLSQGNRCVYTATNRGTGVQIRAHDHNEVNRLLSRITREPDQGKDESDGE